MVVVAVDAHDARAVDRGVEHLGGLQVGGNENTGVETLLSGLRGDSVGKIAGRRATHRGEIKPARRRERGGDDAILEGKGRKANRVILEIEILQAPFRGELARSDQRRATNGVWAAVAFGKWEKLGIAPHVEV